MKESSYGHLKRYNFVKELVGKEIVKATSQKIRILDIGCGTGEMLTLMLAVEFNEKVEITAFDTDSYSIIHLKKQVSSRDITNVYPIEDFSKLAFEKFDIIILSEVIEHVSSPVDLLFECHNKLYNNGVMLVTLPNGYGYFEFDNLLEGTLIALKIESVIKKIKLFFNQSKSTTLAVSTIDTLAVSPHINFFTYKQIHSIFSKVGLQVISYEGRMFACGRFISGLIERSSYLINLNLKLGTQLPPYLISGWMFILQPVTPDKNRRIENDFNKLHEWYISFKRWLMKKRYNISAYDYSDFWKL